MNNKVNTMVCMYDSATDPYIISYNNNKSYHNATSIIKKKKLLQCGWCCNSTTSFTLMCNNLITRLTESAPTTRFCFIDATKKKGDYKMMHLRGSSSCAQDNCEFRLLMMIMAPRALYIYIHIYQTDG